MKFFKKHLTNILFIGFIIFLFTPYGLPVRATLIRGVSFITTRVFSMEIDKEDQIEIEGDWQLLSLEGKQQNISSFAGQVIVVNIWATWCPPCIAEMPGLQELYDDYGDRVVFLFVANDDPEKVKAFLKKNNYDLPVFFQITNAPEALESNSLPTTMIINGEGKIIVHKTGAADWNSRKVRDLLDQLLS